MLTKALAILALSTTTFAQPAGDPPPQTDPRPPSQAQRQPPQDPESLQKRLTQTLEFAKRIVEKHEAALAQLAQGQDPKEVMRELRSPELRKGFNGNAHHLRAQGQPQGPGDNAHKHSPPQSISKRDLKRVRNFIKENLPDIDSKLQMIEKMSPNSTEKLLARLAPKVIEILRLKEVNPTMSGLKIDELKAGLNYVNATTEYRAIVNAESSDQSQLDEALEVVRKAASDRFDSQVQIKQFEIHELTMRIQQLHIALENLTDQRDDQVQAQVNAAQKNTGTSAKRAARFKQRLLESQQTQQSDEKP